MGSRTVTTAVDTTAPLFSVRSCVHMWARSRGLHVQRHNVILVWVRHPVADACRKLLKTLLSPSSSLLPSSKTSSLSLSIYLSLFFFSFPFTPSRVYTCTRRIFHASFHRRGKENFLSVNMFR